MQVQTQSPNLRLAMTELQRWGFSDAILPFLLFFAILFAVLQQIKLFDDRKINAVLSFVISMMIVVPHIIGAYPAARDPVLIMYKILPTSTIIIIAVTLAILLMGLTDMKVPAPLLLMIGLGAVGIVLYVILANMFPTIGWAPVLDSRLQALLIVILVFGLVVYFIVREPKSEAEKAKYHPYPGLRELFGWPGRKDGGGPPSSG